ncbi:Proline iminopeptidase (PIP) (Prolyl aminopeptidase) (PAP) [Durusdinium trenchii]|uniref:Proline iminopeptidase n=2 Tax=Durusdinium trenchii TaxID=1381693 RepID=A0ABP0SBN9_9DINO
MIRGAGSAPPSYPHGPMAQTRGFQLGRQFARWAPLASTALLWPTGPRGPRSRGIRRCSAEELRTPFPEIEARKTGNLVTVDGTHSLYYEVSGNPKGKVVLFLHGGPGDGSSPKHRRLFDPEVFCIVAFDQRGAGQSVGKKEFNTTEKLVQDIEQLRLHLGVESWELLVGGSWGSTLALAYSTRFPARVKAMVLYSIFIPSQASIEFPYSAAGAGLFFPEAHEAFAAAVDATGAQPGELLGRYAERLASEDTKVRNAARSAYLRWIMRLLSLEPDESIIEEVARNPEDAGDGLAIEMRYMANGCFVDADQLLEECKRIAHLPCAIVHGRNDLLCPPANAWRLRQRLPRAKLIFVPQAGHSSSLAPALRSEILKAIDGHR